MRLAITEAFFARWEKMNALRAANPLPGIEIPSSAACAAPEVTNLPYFHQGLLGRINSFILDRRMILAFWGTLTIVASCAIFFLVYKLWKTIVQHQVLKADLLQYRGSVSNRVFDPADDDYPPSPRQHGGGREFPSSFSLRGHLLRSGKAEELLRGMDSAGGAE